MKTAPLVLLHGWCGDHDSWPPLFDGRQVTIPDLTHDGSLFVPDQPSILIGHSMGATLARRIARVHPEKVVALVLVDGHLPKYQPDRARRETFLRAFREEYASAAGAYVDSLIGPRTPAAVKRGMLAKSPAMGLAALESLNNPDVCAWTGTPEDVLRMPVLALWAAPSQMARVGNEHEQWMRQWCTNLRYETWPGASHFLHIDEPERFEALVFEFFNSQNL